MTTSFILLFDAGPELLSIGLRTLLVESLEGLVGHEVGQSVLGEDGEEEDRLDHVRDRAGQ